jgi:hypothetical protein
LRTLFAIVPLLVGGVKNLIIMLDSMASSEAGARALTVVAVKEVAVRKEKVVERGEINPRRGITVVRASLLGLGEGDGEEMIVPLANSCSILQ